MWSFASNALAGATGQKRNSPQHSQACSECSDDEVSFNPTRDEGLECPICCESFNIVENVPCIMVRSHSLQELDLGTSMGCRKISYFTNSAATLHLLSMVPPLSFRLVYKGSLKFPRKNFFLLWMVESLNEDRVKIQHSDSSFTETNHRHVWPSNNLSTGRSQVDNNHVNLRRTPSPHGDHQEQRIPVPNQASTVSNYLNRESLI